MTDDAEGSSVNIWIAYADLLVGVVAVLSIFLFHGEFVQRGTIITVDEAEKNAREIIRQIGEEMKEKRGLEINENSAAIRMGGDVNFADCSDQLTAEGRQTLEDVAESLKKHIAEIQRSSLRISVEGHTDGYLITVPCPQSNIRDNWELSSRRATSVVKLFESRRELPRELFTAVGYADVQPLPGVPLRGNPKKTEQERRKETVPQRRVEVRLGVDYHKIDSLANQPKR